MIHKEISCFKSGIEKIDESLVDLSLFYYGWEVCNPGHKWTDVRETNYIHIILKGKGTFKINGKTFKLSGGDAFCIFENQSATYFADIKEPWTYLWVGFLGTKAPEILMQAGFTNNTPVNKISNTEVFNMIIKKMIRVSKRTYIDALKRRGLFLEFISELLKLNEINFDSNLEVDDFSNVNTKKAYLYIKNNYAKSIEIQDIAKMLGINRNYLSQLFKKKYNLSPKQFLQKTRMKNAVGLMYNKSLNIQQISNLVGYEDSCAFSKSFKIEYNISPTKFRKNMFCKHIEP